MANEILDCRGLKCPQPILKIAIKALRQAVGKGNAEAQFRLGMLYANGEGVELDHAKAAGLILDAAKQGHAQAQTTLGWLYANGYGVDQDDARARTWYQRAAESGDLKAQYTLGTLYRFGQLGADKDGAKAVHWYMQAADRGLAAAQFALGRLLMDGKLVAQDEETALQWAWEAPAATNADVVDAVTRMDLCRSRMLSFMENHDVILCPVNASPAMKHGSEGDQELRPFSYTMTYNLTGWPGAVVRGGLPLGIQIVARPWREDIVLAVAGLLERELGGFQAPDI